MMLDKELAIRESNRRILSGVWMEPTPETQDIRDLLVELDSVRAERDQLETTVRTLRRNLQLRAEGLIG